VKQIREFIAFYIVLFLLFCLSCATHYNDKENDKEMEKLIKIREVKINEYIRHAKEKLSSAEDVELLDIMVAEGDISNALDLSPNLEQKKEIVILQNKITKIRLKYEKEDNKRRKEAEERDKKRAIEEMREKQIKEKETPGTPSYRQEYVKNHHALSKRTKNDILKGLIRIGMTKEQATASWGRPQDINRSVGSWGVHEQWIYGEFPHSTYVYFDNGKLTSWQD